MATMVPEPTDTQADNTRLNWLDILSEPEPEYHYCNCEWCDHSGEPIEQSWPMLVNMDVAGDHYVTDRYLAIRADLAPVPVGYEPVTSTAIRQPTGFVAASVTSEVVPDDVTRATTVAALAITGWSLRSLDGYDKNLAVVDEAGTHIGWAVREARH